MPRKKRSVRSGPDLDGCLPSHSRSSRDGTLPDEIIRNSFAIGEDIHPAECLRNVQEMFQGRLDADVIHMVLTECEFNVNNALEALFTLLPQESGTSLVPVASSSCTGSNNLSSSSSSESLATGENIVTSEAEVHKSSEESERESLAGTDGRRTSVSTEASILARFVDAPPFVPNVLKCGTPADPLCTSSLGNSQPNKGESSLKENIHARGIRDSLIKQDDILTMVSSEDKVLVLLRGLPGSGKSVLANKIRGCGIILSTDHFFYRKGLYEFDRRKLSEAHEWNKRRARQAIQDGRSPVIIDNTNVEVWEMMPYVALAVRAKYSVFVLEPDTPWKFNPKQLAMRNTHGVGRRAIEAMLERYDHSVTADSLCQNLKLFPKEPNSENSLADPVCSSSHLASSAIKRPIPDDTPESRKVSCASNNRENQQASSPTETISLKDLMALVQDDSEESGSRSRQNSDSWSSGQDANDWEDAMERDGDFLWATSSKPLSPRSHVDLLTESALSEEPEIIDSEDKDNKAASDLVNTPIPKQSQNESCETVLNKDREVAQGSPNTQPELPLSHDEPSKLFILQPIPDFVAPWNPAGEVTEESPKPQRSPQRCRNSPQRSGNRARSSSPATDVSHTVPRVADSSRQGSYSFRKPVFGLEKVVRSNTWTFPEFVTYEPSADNHAVLADPVPVTKEAWSSTDSSDFKVMQKVLSGESDELPVLVGRILTENESDAPVIPQRWNMVERGTDTSDLPASNLDLKGRLTLLQECIPDARSPDLEDIFHRCHGDHVWAADLLLESSPPCDLQPLVIEEDGDYPKPTNPAVGGHLSSSTAETGEQQSCPLPETKVADSRSNKKVKLKGLPSEKPVRKLTNEGFTFVLDHSFACQLVESFGSGGLHVAMDAFSNKDLTVTISSDTARELHRHWMDTLRCSMTKEDEEMMEMVASEQEEMATRMVDTNTKESPAECVPPPTLDEDPRWSKAPHEMSFREIMEMESALEEKRKNWSKNNMCMDMATKLKHKQLYDRFPGIDRQALDDIFVASNYSLIQSVSTINETLGVVSDEDDAEAYEKQIVELVALESMKPTDPDDEWQPVVEGHKDLYDRLQLVGDYDVIRQEATVHYHMRQESFRKAKEAYHRGMKTVAAFYSQQGRAYAEKMREANERASEKLLQLRNSNSDDNSLDLHGLHVQEAIQVLKNFVKLKKREAWCLQKKLVLRIITGRGAHSSLSIPKIKFAVEGFLLSSQLNYKEVQAGMFHVML